MTLVRVSKHLHGTAVIGLARHLHLAFILRDIGQEK